MRVSYCRKMCCTVKWCPLVTSWATTIHKFQGFEAGTDIKDMFRYLICDPGDLKWEQDCPGALYVALSRARTMGYFRSGLKFTKKSVIYWVGDGINKIRIIEGSLKKGAKKGDSKVKCELIKKRERWVQYLEQQRNATTSKNYQTSDIKHLHQSRYSQSDLQIQIAKKITQPNETWLTLKKKEYMTPKTYFGTYL